MTSRILGLLRDMAMAAFFDRHVTDAWTAAFRLPNLFRRLFGEGSLSVSFIPIFIDLRSSQEHAEIRARNLVNSFYVLLLSFTAVLTLLGLIFMQPLLEMLLDSAYTQDGTKFILTIKMARLMFGFVFFVVTYAYFMGILQALGEFAWPALAPALFNITMLIFTLLPASLFGIRGEGLAWGVLAGGVLQALALIPILQKKNYLPAFCWTGFSQDLRQLLIRVLPGVLGVGMIQLVTVVNLHFASALGEGVISTIYWADRLLELPLSLVAVSLSAALLPTLAKFWSLGQSDKLFATAQAQIIISGFWLVPAALGLYVLAQPIVEVLFYHGEFSSVDLLRTTQILQIYAGSLLTLSLIRMLLPILYAAHQVWGPALCSFAALCIHLILAPILIHEAGLRGLIISTFFCSIFNLVFLLGLISWKIKQTSWRVVLVKYGQFFISASGLWFCPRLYLFIYSQSGIASLALAIAIATGALSYLLIGRLFNFHPMFHLNIRYIFLKKRTR